MCAQCANDAGCVDEELMNDVVHIKAKDRRPLCDAVCPPGCGLIFGGANTVTCEMCRLLYERHPDAPDRCSVCGYYHHHTATKAFHELRLVGEDERQ